MATNVQTRGGNNEPISSDSSDSSDDNEPFFDQESYCRDLKAYKNESYRNFQKMCKKEFKKNCDELLTSAHRIMQHYVQFGEFLSDIFKQLSLKDGEMEGAENDHNLTLANVFESLHSKYESNFLKLMEPFPHLKQMSFDYGVALEQRIEEIKEMYRTMLEPPAPQPQQ